MVIFHSLLYVYQRVPVESYGDDVFFWDESGTEGRSFWAVDWFDCLFDANLMEFRVSSKMFQRLHVWCLDVCWVWIKKTLNTNIHQPLGMDVSTFFHDSQWISGGSSTQHQRPPVKMPGWNRTSLQLCVCHLWWILVNCRSMLSVGLFEHGLTCGFVRKYVDQDHDNQNQPSDFGLFRMFIMKFCSFPTCSDKLI